MSNLTQNYFPLLGIIGLLFSFQVCMLIYYFSRKSDKNQCPVCNNKLSGTRVPRPFLVKLFLSIYIHDIRYYKCLSCYNHFFINPSSQEKTKIEQTDSTQHKI